MNLDELRDSKEIYAFKATSTRYDPFSEDDRAAKAMRQIRGAGHVPCSEMRVYDPSGKEVVVYQACKTPPKGVSILKTDDFCFSNCVFPMNVSRLNEEQWELYLQKRPKLMKVVDYRTFPENRDVFTKEFPEIEELFVESEERLKIVPAPLL
jgi:hypothetical protein